MGRGNGAAHGGLAAVVGKIDGPQADMAALALEHEAAVREQDARYAVKVELVGSVQAAKFTLINKHVDEVKPVSIYIAIPVLLKQAGICLAGLDLGEARG